MARNRHSASEHLEREDSPLENSQNDAEDSDIDINMGDDVAPSDSDMAKSDTEMELEKLVFGDSAGFRSGLSTFREDRFDQDGLGDNEDQGALATVDDADVGFNRGRGLEKQDQRLTYHSCSS